MIKIQTKGLFNKRWKEFFLSPCPLISIFIHSSRYQVCISIYLEIRIIFYLFSFSHITAHSGPFHDHFHFTVFGQPQVFSNWPLDILGQIMLCCRGLEYALEDIQQHRWPLPSWCQHLHPTWQWKIFTDIANYSLEDEITQGCTPFTKWLIDIPLAGNTIIYLPSVMYI